MQTNAVKTFLLCDIFDKRNAAMFASGLKGFLGQIMQHLAYCILNPRFERGYVRLSNWRSETVISFERKTKFYQFQNYYLLLVRFVDSKYR